MLSTLQHSDSYTMKSWTDFCLGPISCRSVLFPYGSLVRLLIQLTPGRTVRYISQDFLILESSNRLTNQQYGVQ